MWSKRFFKAAAERALSTAAQAAVAVLTADNIGGLIDVSWTDTASVAGLAALLSVLKSVGAGVVDGQPSIGTKEVLK